ncbi:MAG: HAMP domain-containing sensor histidine kinase [Terricaulis sp.]
MDAIAAKWRPTLSMITAAVIVSVLVLPLVGLVFFRFYENQLVRQTESELIAQAAVLGAVYQRAIAAAPPEAFPIGPARPPSDPAIVSDERYAPINAALDLATSPILPKRPDAHAAFIAPEPGALAVGAELYSITAQAQRTTLAGFRLLDANGVVIAGREEVGATLSMLEEVRAARMGRFAAVMRVRERDTAPPPLYSISRGTNIRVFVAYPVFVDNQVRGIVYLSRTPDNIFRQLYAERERLAAALLLVLACAAAIGAVFVRTVTRPMRDLARRAEAITGGDRAAIGPLAHHGTRELASLTQSFMTMAKRLSDRSDYLSTFAAHVTHEFKTPLSAILGAAELMQDGEASMSAEERRRFLAHIRIDAERMSALLDRLRDLARADNPELGGSVKLSEIVFALRARFAGLEIVSDADAVLPMSHENALIVFANLADNARRHGATEVSIGAESDAQRISVRFSDNGAGVSHGNRARIFDPFFTTRRDEGGAGMGLGIVRALLRAHGGDVALAESDRGAAFELTLLKPV